MIRSFVFLSAALLASALADNWPQGPGANFDFTSPKSDAPSEWSASLDQNIAWRATMPETGQSSPIVQGDRIFVTTMKPVEADAKTGSDIVAWCLSAKDGTILWKRDIPGGYQTRLSGPFGDASSPAAVTDGKHVWILNPTGKLACFDLDGNPRWTKEVTSVSRTRPILFEGNLIFHRQVYKPNESGAFGHEKKGGMESWTQLQALAADTGAPVWVSECGVNMGSIPLLQKLADGTAVFVVGRGGGHGPPESPDGVSMIRADNGKTLWSLELEKFMSTQTYPVVNGHALVFHKDEHLWVDARTGKIARRISIVENVPVRIWTKSGHQSTTETLEQKKPRSITQQSNLRVGNFHYFRAYTRNYLGRVNIETGDVEYLELPLQILWEEGKEAQIAWCQSIPMNLFFDKKGKKKYPLDYTTHPNAVRNSRGFQVMGDKRAQNNGWGHIASPLATAFGNRLIVPIQSGIVFVLQADAEVLDEGAILGMNDLGPLGEAYSRASVTTDGTRIYARTIKEVIAIGKDVEN